MLKGQETNTQYDWAGHFADAKAENDYRSTSWNVDRANIARVGWVAGIALLISYSIDVLLLELTSAQLMWDLGIRCVGALGAISLALVVRRAAFHRSWDDAAFAIELLIIGCYFALVAVLNNQVVNEAAILVAIAIFIWFYVPIHAKYAIASTVTLFAGQIALNTALVPVDPAEGGMTLFLVVAVSAMGFLSKRAREQLRRENFQHERRLSESNEALRHEVETRARAEAREANARERFELLFRVSPMPLALTEVESRTVVQVNDTLLRLFDRKEGDIVGNSIDAFVERTPGMKDYISRVGTEDQALSSEFQFTSLNGASRDCVATSVQFVMDGKDHILTGLYDITERKDHERDLIDAKDKAEAARQTQSAFLATMSHELRTPLNALLGFIQLVELDDLPRETKQNLTMARQSGQHILQLISDILDLSKLSAGRLNIQASPVDCRDLVENSLATFKLAAAEKGIELQLDATLQRDIVNIDDIRIRQVLLNLIGNAVKFTAEGFVKLKVRQGTATDRETLRFEVSDTGIGIAPSKLDEIFLEFRQADTTTTRAYGGSGLGLSISKKLVEAMGGEMGVSSVPGQGSTFWFVVPELPSQNQTENAHTHAA